MRRLAAALAAAAAWSSLALSSAPSPAPERRTLRLRYKPADREVGRYQYVPVTIDAGTTRLEIAYRYDKVGGANAVDLGLLEPGPLALGTPARRGWSGGARDRVVVADTEATPGYWPGPLPAGEWHVALGRLLVIGGEEVTTPGGHANVWGLAGGGARSTSAFRPVPARSTGPASA